MHNLVSIAIFIRRRGYLILAFFLPALMLGLVYASLGISPIGPRSILVSDLDIQYVDFYAALRRMIFAGESPLYSWSLLLGWNMMGIISYYLSSPFSLIILLFPGGKLVDALFWMTLIKTGSAGLSMAIFLEHSRRTRSSEHDVEPPSSWLTLIFSVPYALMAYLLSYSPNLMWLDGLIFLPLIALGIEKIARGERANLYYGALALMLIANYYIGYMLCLFAPLYFVYQCVGWHDRHLGQQLWRQGKRFVAASLLSAGTAAFLLLPTYYTLASGKLTFEQSALALTPKFSPLDLLPKLMFGVYDLFTGNLPNLYCGIAVGFLAGLFFLSRPVSLRRKIAAAALLAVLLLSMYWSGLDLVWHGFQAPKGYPYRYSFLVSFLLVCLAHEAFSQLSRISPRIIAALFLLGLVVIAGVKGQSWDFLPDKILLFSLMLLGLSAALIFVFQRFPNLRRPVTILLALLVIAEAGLNSWVFIRKLNGAVHYGNQSAYPAFIEQVRPVVQKIQRDDPGFYRIEKTFVRSFNDSLSLDYPGISHFSSSFSRPTLSFLKQMGFYQAFYRLLYTGQTALLDAILGVKYLLAQEPVQNPYPIINQGTEESGQIQVYQNPYALPVGFMVDPGLAGLHITSYHPLYWQNQMLRGMIGSTTQDYFLPLQAEQVIFNNVEKHPDQPGWVRYTRQQEAVNAAGVDATIEYHLRVERSEPVYAFLVTQDNSKMKVTLNGKFLAYVGENTENNQLLLLGQYPPGTEITLTLTLMFSDAVLLDDPLIYRLDMGRFAQAYQDLATHPLEISAFGDTFLRGSVSAAPEKTLLFTSIPDDAGWTVRLDGQEAPKLRLLDAFIGVTIPAGQHTVEFSYFPPGLKAGSAITVISLLLAALVLWRQRRS